MHFGSVLERKSCDNRLREPERAHESSAEEQLSETKRMRTDHKEKPTFKTKGNEEQCMFCHEVEDNEEVVWWSLGKVEKAVEEFEFWKSRVMTLLKLVPVKTSRRRRNHPENSRRPSSKFTQGDAVEAGPELMKQAPEGAVKCSVFNLTVGKKPKSGIMAAQIAKELLGSSLQWTQGGGHWSPHERERHIHELELMAVYYSL
ncbi:Hypp633 [Branchiostoma lanceolatum]|uniref:Hypp633 protein n=1 Tax=Branchiostoma lanceolatum TaxID=7740 RepID=A0A8J9VN92_BRALA|nr:Hypp633 [Branchiostoma lanceolatum]